MFLDQCSHWRLVSSPTGLSHSEEPSGLETGRLAHWKNQSTGPSRFILNASSTVCLLFALQWGGVRFPWTDGRIIALFVLFGLLGLAFSGAQAWRQDTATVPPKIFFQRTILAGCIASICIGSLIVIYAYYLPIWFQAIQGKSPQSSGLSLVALLLSNVLFVIGSGFATSRLGYYTPIMIIGAAVTIVGSALISTWGLNAGPAQWIGFQVRSTSLSPRPRAEDAMTDVKDRSSPAPGWVAF